MNELVLYCKSYRNDVERVRTLLESVVKHNKSAIPFYISVPAEDVELFRNALGTSDYTLVTDDEICGRFAQSWISQQIVKASFWKLGTCKNYVMIDSDSYFIRDFTVEDFMIEGVPYTVMHEQKDLFHWTVKNIQTLGFDPQKSFGECRLATMGLFDRKGRLYDFGPSPVIWSSEVWKSLEEKYIKPNDLTLEKAICSIASEFTWYGEWLLVDKTIPIWPVEPIFKVFHYLPQYQEYKNNGYTEEHWSRNYLGLVMQSSSGLPMKY